MDQLKNIGLIIVVVIIWGYLGYVLYNKINPKENSPVLKDQVKVMELESTPYKLILDYEDPFLGSAKVEKVVHQAPQESKVQPRRNEPKEKPKPQPKWPSIEYYGFAKKEGNTVYLALSINGESQIIKSSDSYNHVKIKDFAEDSITCVFNNEQKVIRLKY